VSSGLRRAVAAAYRGTAGMNRAAPRRALVMVVAGLALAACTAAPPVITPWPPPSASAASAVPTGSPAEVFPLAFGGLELTFDARLEVFAVDTGSGRAVSYRSDERFGYASTFKALAAGAVLDASSTAQLDEVVRYTKMDVLPNSPITSGHAGTGMTLRRLGDAAVRYSDNTAGNLLLERLGGPDGFERALRGLGDKVTEAGRMETALNSAVPGDRRDTSTARALIGDLRAYVLGDALGVADRAVPTGWLQGNTTGDTLIRAGVPAGWRVGDKTGSGGYGTRNDIAVLWPPSGAPIVMAIPTSRSEKDAGYDDKLIAQAAAMTIRTLRPGGQ
jgi:beta-lactamase class A